MEASSFRFFFFKLRVFFKGTINPWFDCAGNLKGVAGVKKQTKLYPSKNCSKSPTSSTFSFNRPSN